MSSAFSNFVHDNPGHAQCAPVSLAAALGLWNLDVSHRRIKRIARKGYFSGMDEHDIERAATHFGFRCDMLCQRRKGSKTFLRELRAHVKKGLPAILLVASGGHWVVVLGLDDEGRYIVMDSEAESDFLVWEEKTLARKSWNTRFDEPDQHFAVLLSEANGRKPVYQFDRSFMRLCEVGSKQSLRDFSNDLKELARRAGKPSTARLRLVKEQRLVDVLAEHEDTIVEAVDHWASLRRKANRREIRAMFRDYLTVAAATDLRVPASVDHTPLITEMTAIMAAYTWNGEL